jgi:hypothetical protein
MQLLFRVKNFSTKGYSFRKREESMTKIVSKFIPISIDASYRMSMPLFHSTQMGEWKQLPFEGKQTQPEDDETSTLELPFEFKGHIFEDYENSLNYPIQVRLQEKTTPFEPHKESMTIEYIQSLSAIMSYEWLREAELSLEVAWITFPSTILLCQVRGSARRVHYNFLSR